jgi:polyhydroxyalkanoate synthesis regulator phasin
MAKKQDKDSRARRTDAVRSAVDQAFQTTAVQGAAAAGQGREAAQDMVDQLATAVGRVREVLDDLRPPTGDDIRSLEKKIAALERRVAALEKKPQPKKPAAPRRTKKTS